MEASITPETPSSGTPDVAAILAAMRTDMERLQVSVQNGDLADARALAPRVETLMTALHTLPKESAREHLPALEAVCAGLDGLVASYRHLAESSRAGLQQLPTLMRASSAYTKQGAIAGTARED